MIEFSYSAFKRLFLTSSGGKAISWFFLSEFVWTFPIISYFSFSIDNCFTSWISSGSTPIYWNLLSGNLKAFLWRFTKRFLLNSKPITVIFSGYFPTTSRNRQILNKRFSKESFANSSVNARYRTPFYYWFNFNIFKI